MKVTPWLAEGLRKVLSKLVWPENSFPPQLIDTATTPGVLAAVVTAVNRFTNEADDASTRRMLAPGATAWAHSTSRAISVAQPELADGRVVPPFWFTTLKVGPPGWLRSGSPQAASN